MMPTYIAGCQKFLSLGRKLGCCWVAVKELKLRDYPAIMENQMEKKMENEMETGGI